MGVEYAIVCDRTKEAFDLGKGWWGEWKTSRYSPQAYQEGVPKTKEGVRAFVDRWIRGVYDETLTPTQLQYLAFITERIWLFVEAHPGCRVVDDACDYSWRTAEQDRRWAEQDKHHVAEEWKTNRDVFMQIDDRYRTKETGSQHR